VELDYPDLPGKAAVKAKEDIFNINDGAQLLLMLMNFVFY